MFSTLVLSIFHYFTVKNHQAVDFLNWTAVAAILSPALPGNSSFQTQIQ